MPPDLLGIERRCQCRVHNPDGKLGRHPPLRFFYAAVEAVARSGILASSTPVMSYRCPTCKSYLYLTAGDCHLGRST